MSQIEFHEAANIFPLDEEHLEELVADIRQHGQQVPIETMAGKVLDGRRRWLACEKAGVEPVTREVNPADPVAYVLSLNLHRRHMTTSQRSMVGARARKIYAQRAKERQLGGLKTGNQLPVPQKSTERGDTRSIAGKAVGVSGFSIDNARKVIEDGVPELVDAVDAGRIPVHTAAKIAARPEAEQRRELEHPAPPGSRNQYTRSDDDGGEREAQTNGKSKAIPLANEAINCLIRIPKNDPLRKRGFQIVTDWIRRNRQE